MFKNLKTKISTTISESVAAASAPKDAPSTPQSSAAADERPNGGTTPRSTSRQVESNAGDDTTQGFTLSPEEQARLENTPRSELIEQVIKLKVTNVRRKRRLVDVVEAYKAIAADKEKLEEALEKQQDAAANRSKEQATRHKADTAAKDKLIAALKQRLEDADGRNKELQSGLVAAASESKTLKDRLMDTERGQEHDDIKFDRLQSELDEKQKQCEQRDKQVAELEKKVKSLTSRSEELQMLIRQKDVDLLAQTERTSSLRQSLQMQGEPQDELNVKLQTATAALEDKEAALASAAQRRVELESEVSELRKKLRERAATAKRSLSAAESTSARRIEQLQKEIDTASAAAKTQVAELESKLNEALRESDRLKQKMADEETSHAKQVESLESQLATLRTRAAATTTAGVDDTTDAGNDSSSMKQTLQIKQHEVEDLQSQLARAGEEADRTRLRLEAEITSLRDEVKRVTTMLESEKEKSASLDARVRQVEALLENERAERSDSVKELEDTQADLQSLEERHAALTNELQSERVKSDSQAQLVGTLERTISEKESLYSILKKSNDELNKRLMAKTEEVIAAGADASALRIQLEAATQSSRTSSAKTMQDMADLSDQVAALKTKLANAKADVAAAKEQATETKKELAAEKAKCREALAATKALESRLSKSESTSTAAEDQIAELTSVVQQLRTDIKAANDRVAAECARAASAEEAQANAERACKDHESTIDTLEGQLKSAKERVKKEQASAASFQYTAQTTEESLQAVTASRNEFETLNATLTQHLLEANRRVAALEEDNGRLAADLSASTTDAASLREQVTDLEVKFHGTQEDLKVALEKCDELESRASASAAKIASLSADLESQIAVKESQDTLLQEQGDELKELREKNELYVSDVEQLRKERTELADRLATTIEQHQRATKLQQQHAAELKRTLQKSLKGQISAGDIEGLNPSTPAAAATQSRAPSGDNTPMSAMSTASASPSSGRKKYPDELDTNLKYLKNVVLKYMTGRRAEVRCMCRALVCFLHCVFFRLIAVHHACSYDTTLSFLFTYHTLQTRHLVKVIGTMLHFTQAEIDNAHRAVDEATSTWINWN
eukprot:m.79433 g.79433  ORF g.79433 m.79433 type:complete len:1092 (-) comp9290_c0_seq1:5-3280(-)